MKDSRPSLKEHFLNRAKVVSERSTCLRRKVGAIIVIDNVQISSGYSGSPRKVKHCIDLGGCLRIQRNIPSGQMYELCRSVHAEQNAIINAARNGVSVVGGVMYISSHRIKGAYKKDEDKKIYAPCIICKKEIINAGIVKVYMREENVGTEKYSICKIKKLLKEDESKWRPSTPSTSHGAQQE